MRPSDTLISSFALADRFILTATFPHLLCKHHNTSWDLNARDIVVVTLLFGSHAKKNSEPPQTSPFRSQKIIASCFERRRFHEISNKDRLFLSYHLHWPSINVTVAYVDITVFALLVETAILERHLWLCKPC